MSDRQFPFSERMGLVQSRSSFQIDSISTDLRSRLLNCFTGNGPRLRDGIANSSPTGFLASIWDGFFKRPLHEIENANYEIVRLFSEGAWFRVYDFLEHVRNRCGWQGSGPHHFTTRCNVVLEEELAGFRFVNGLIAPVVSPEELEAIDIALANRVPLARQHIAKALELLSARTNPNYAKSIQESISAVEAELRDVTGDASATIGDALKVVKRGTTYHPVLLAALDKLYGWTNADGGIRHADKGTGQPPDRALAKFILVTCCAFVNHLEELRAK
jgi:hypothetical protein